MHRSDSHQHQGSSRGLSIAVFCAMAIIALVLYSRVESGVNLLGGDNILVGILLSAFAGAISLFGYLLARNSGRVQSSGLWQLIEGLSALIPPAVIAMCLLPVSAEARPWILIAFLVVGFFAIVSLTNVELSDGQPHKFHQREYLFDRGLGQPFLATIDVVTPETNLPRRRRRDNFRDNSRVDSRDDDTARGRSHLAQVDNRTNDRLAVGVAAQTAAPPAPVVDGKLQQQISRFTATNGDDRVEAIWSVHFDQQQKRTVVHVPFSPAFANRPNVECSVVDGDGVTLKVAEVHPYGVRIEARRSQMDRAADVTIGFHASAKPSSARTGASTGRRPVVGNEFTTTVEDAGRATTDAIANVGRGLTDSVSQTASSLGQRASKIKRAVTGTDPVFSLGNPVEKVRQSVERISRTTGPHNPPGEFPADPGSNSSSSPN